MTLVKSIEESRGTRSREDDALASCQGRRGAGVTVTALVPAHNEEPSIAATIKSLQNQTRVPDSITVMCDNCTDRTAEIALGMGVNVMHSVDNTGRKAGAMNQALAILLPPLGDEDIVLCMDADTEIDPDLIRNASRHFAQTEHLGAVSSNHLVRKTANLMELLQAMEYERDRRFIGRRKGKFGCMTGMAALYKVAALREVIASSYGDGTVYDPSNWTEDWKLTIALKHLRWNMVRPQDCLASTVPVSTVKGLYIQRERWARGYLQTLCQFGLTRWTAIPWFKQLGLFWSMFTRILILVLLGIVMASGHHIISLWMLPVAVILAADSVNTVYPAGWKAVAVALIFPIEIAYSWLITAAICAGYFKHLTGAGANDTWQRVRR